MLTNSQAWLKLKLATPVTVRQSRRELRALRAHHGVLRIPRFLSCVGNLRERQRQRHCRLPTATHSFNTHFSPAFPGCSQRGDKQTLTWVRVTCGIGLCIFNLQKAVAKYMHFSACILYSFIYYILYIIK